MSRKFLSLLAVLIVISFSYSAAAQVNTSSQGSADYKWVKYFRTDNTDNEPRAVVDGNGIFLSAQMGTAVGTSFFWDAYISKLDNSGGIIWDKFFKVVDSGAGPMLTLPLASAKSLDVPGEYFISGYGALNNPAGYKQPFFAKINGEGNIPLAKLYLSGTSYSIFTDMMSFVPTEVVMTGELRKISPSTISDIYQLNFARVDKANGSVLVSKIYKHSNTGVALSQPAIAPIDRGSSIIFGTTLGEVAVPGNYPVAVGLFKTDHDGNIIWSKQLKRTGEDGWTFLVSDIIVDSENKIVVVGSIKKDGSIALKGAFAAKLNSDGSLVWYREFDVTPADPLNNRLGFKSVVQSSGDDYVIGGEAVVNSINKTFFVKLSQGGSMLWKRAQKDLNNLYTIAETQNRSIVAATSDNLGFYVVKADKSGNTEQCFTDDINIFVSHTTTNVEALNLLTLSYNPIVVNLTTIETGAIEMETGEQCP